MKCYLIVVLLGLSLSYSAHSQNKYLYKVDLTRASGNQLEVELENPKLPDTIAIYSFPKIIPGTYMISDFGRFISELKAFDKKGNQMPVQQLNTDQWKISNAQKVKRITYNVEGIFDTKKPNDVYPMAATNIQPNENIVLNTPGFFGYFENMKQLPVTLQFTKPNNFFESSSVEQVSSSANKDVLQLENVYSLYDKPIMYSVPDTATIRVGNCNVLFSVYAPGKSIHAKEIAEVIRPVLSSALTYLGGKLPVDHYSFIYYFHAKGNKSFKPGIGGALEHETSSFYYLKEDSIQKNKALLADVSTHEFFHIITPLTLASEEVKYFNYDQPVMSKHLWLYEGCTEYTAQYIQERYGLITPENFLSRLAFKIRKSRKDFNDSLPFTELSKESAGKYNDQFSNVYLKGAMIACCLDIYLLHLSDGKYGLHNLIADLSVKYGMKKPFNDANLFDEIGAMTYPEIRKFFVDYVESGNPIPYDYYFDLAGIRYIHPMKTSETILLANERANSADSITIQAASKKAAYTIDKLDFADNATNHQMLVRNAWLGTPANKSSTTN
jgi:Predicted protease with the C-terminal PDZ domain